MDKGTLSDVFDARGGVQEDPPFLRVDFNTLSAKSPEAFSREALVQSIIAERADLAHRTFYVCTYGNTAHTVFAGDEVFKGIRYVQHAEKLQQEYGVINTLQGQGLPVPTLTHISVSGHFYGMTRLDGVTYESMKGSFMLADEIQLGKDIGRFASGLANAFPKADLDAGDLRKVSNIEMSVFEQDILKYYMREDFDLCRREIAAFIDRATGQAKVMRDADFHDENVLVDPITKRLSGVIDFGAVQYDHLASSGLCYEGSFPRTVQKAAWQEYASLQEGVDARDQACFAICRWIRQNCYRPYNPVLERDALKNLYRCVSDLKETCGLSLVPSPVQDGFVTLSNVTPDKTLLELFQKLDDLGVKNAFAQGSGMLENYLGKTPTSYEIKAGFVDSSFYMAMELMLRSDTRIDGVECTCVDADYFTHETTDVVFKLNFRDIPVTIHINNRNETPEMLAKYGTDAPLTSIAVSRDGAFAHPQFKMHLAATTYAPFKRISEEDAAVRCAEYSAILPNLRLQVATAPQPSRGLAC